MSSIYIQTKYSHSEVEHSYRVISTMNENSSAIRMKSDVINRDILKFRLKVSIKTLLVCTNTFKTEDVSKCKKNGKVKKNSKLFLYKKP